MRNSAFRTVTTNSRGVKSSLTRMTLCRRGRSVLVLTLVFGLVTASIISGGSSRSLPWRLSLGVQVFGVQVFGGQVFAFTPIPPPAGLRNRQFAMASLQRRHGAQIGNDVGQIVLLQAGIIGVGH